MAVQFYDGGILFDSGKVAMHEDCCCCECCDYPLCGTWPSSFTADMSEPYLINRQCNICSTFPTDLLFNKVSETSSGCWKVTYYEHFSEQACGDHTVRFTGEIRIEEFTSGPANHWAKANRWIPAHFLNERFSDNDVSQGWCQAWFHNTFRHYFSAGETCNDFFPYELPCTSLYTACYPSYGPACSYYHGDPLWSPKVTLEL